MSHHILSLFFPENPNESLLLIDDTSIYDTNLLTLNSSSSDSSLLTPCDGIQVPCANIQVTPPGFMTPTSIDVNYGRFRLVLNACTLGICAPSNCAISCPDIPDGLYNIRYSVAPNDQVYVEYKILRITQAINRRNALLCKIGLTPCLPDKETQYQIDSLQTIWNYLIAAKTMVENKHQFTDGMNLYRFAIQCMDKMAFHPQHC